MRALDLFSGIGLFSLGMHRAGFQTVAACELMEWKRLIFAELVGDMPMYADIKDLTGERVLHDVGPVELVFGSPPCTDASSANSRGRGVDGEQTGLFFEAIRLVRELRPRWTCLENVPPLRTRGADRVLAALEEAGYATWPLVVGADSAGAPHIRKRVWIVGLRADAHEDGVRQQPRRCGGPNGQGETVACQPNGAEPPRQQVGPSGQPRSADAAHPHRQGEQCQPVNGEVAGGAGELSPHHQINGRRAWRQGRPDPSDTGQPEQALQAVADACEPRTERSGTLGGRGRRQEAPSGNWHAPQPSGAGLAFWQSLAGDHGPQLAALERDIGPAIHDWAGGLGRYLCVAHGLPAKTARMLMSAAGDGVVVRVAEAIGNAIRHADKERGRLG